MQNIISKKRTFLFLIMLIIFSTALIVSCRRSTTGKTPEFFFKNSKVVELCKAISNNDEAKIDSLLKQGVDVNSIGKDGMNPLLWALSFNDIKTFEMVLKKGGNPNIRLTKGNGTSVMILVSKMPENDFLKLTLKYGGDPNIEDFAFKTPLFHVISSDETSLEKVKILIDSGGDVNNQDITDRTPAMYAAALNQYHIVYYLLKNGGDIRLKDNANNSLIYYIKNSYQNMLKSGKLYDYLMKCVELIKKDGTKIDLNKKPKSNYEKLPEDWKEKRRALGKEKEQKRQQNLKESGSKIKPTIDASEAFKQSAK